MPTQLPLSSHRIPEGPALGTVKCSVRPSAEPLCAMRLAGEPSGLCNPRVGPNVIMLSSAAKPDPTTMTSVPVGARVGDNASMRGDPEIFIADASGANPKRATANKGGNSSPAWNPKTGAQIAFVSGRTGLPQIYTMETDGTNLQRMTEGGYAVSPSWSPNGSSRTSGGFRAPS